MSGQTPNAIRMADRDVYRKYLDVTSDRPPSPIFDVLDPFLPASGDAIDLGCGAGRGTLRLLSRGLKVTATDVAQEAIDLVKSKLPPEAPARLVCAPFQELELTPESYDVVVACYSLFFLPPDEFQAFWNRVVGCLRPEGLFAGEFLGVNDTWADRGHTVLDEPAVLRLFDGFEVLHFQEEDKDGPTAVGDSKHWHVFHVIARKV